MKEKKSFLLICAVCMLSLMACPCIPAENESNPVRNEFLNGTEKELSFGPVVSGLAGTGIIASKSDGATIPLAKNFPAGTTQETIHFSLDTSQTSLKTIRNKDYLKIEGLKPHGRPGEPQVPFKSFVVTLPVNGKVLGVNVSNVSYRPLLNKLNIISAPMPAGYAKNTQNEQQTITTDAEKQTPNIKESYSTCKTCKLDSFFPGNLVSYMTSEDNKNLFVFIKFFPVQYIQGSQRAILITGADITVNYQVIDTGQTGEKE